MKDPIKVIKARYESLMNEMNYYELEINLLKARFVNEDAEGMQWCSDHERWYKEEYNSRVSLTIELRSLLEECGYEVLEDWENEKVILKEVNV